jgi:nicotinamidase/pyrazinamidase
MHRGSWRLGADVNDVIEYDNKTALIVVDVQNDFADPRGNLHVPGGASIIPTINQEIQRARSAGATVVYTQDWHPESTPHFEKDGGIWPIHCVKETWGAEPAFQPSGRRRSRALGVAG